MKTLLMVLAMVLLQGCVSSALAALLEQLKQQ
jgi:hypothetical protein